MRLAGRPGVEVGHGPVGIDEGKPVGVAGDVTAELFPTEALGIVAEGVAEGLGGAVGLRQNEGGEAVGDALGIAGLGFGPDVVDEIGKVPQVLGSGLRKQREGDEGEGSEEEGRVESHGLQVGVPDRGDPGLHDDNAEGRPFGMRFARRGPSFGILWTSGRGAGWGLSLRRIRNA